MEEIATVFYAKAKEHENPLNLLLALQPTEAFVGKVLTIADYVDHIQDTYGRKIEDATVRVLIKDGKIDGVYFPHVRSLKYLVLMTEKTAAYTPRKYNRATNREPRNS